MEEFVCGGDGNTLCLSLSCMQCKKYNQRKVVMCRHKDCKMFPGRFTIKDKATGKESPYMPEDPTALAANFPRKTLRSRGF